MKPEAFAVRTPLGESVTAIAYAESDAKRKTLVLGHGAGADQNHSFMIACARGVCERGVNVVTFNFEYTEKKKKIPDPKAKLEACYRAVLADVRKRFKMGSLVIGGKSMGGRIASQIAAEGEHANALVFLGYPLHPPGKPDQLRDAHLPSIKVPMLFVQGERDAFGTPNELAPILGRLGGNASLFIIESGDHSFHIPKNAGVQSEVFTNIFDEVARFVISV
jgi:predicted alpha/beta-hydrolase family hydrolase